MSDISNSNSSSSSKRRLNQIDDTIEYLTQDINTLNNFVYKTEFECSLMTVKMKREKLRALEAVAKSQVLRANMEVLVAESDLYMDIERLRNFKRRKLDNNEGKSQVDTTSPPQATKTTVSVQTTKSMFDKKKKRGHSSSRKSPVDISSDETVIIPSIPESSTSLVEASKTPPTSFSLSLFTNQTPANKSDSEVSLSSSIKAEFNDNELYTNTQESVKKSPIKKQKTESKSQKTESKSKSKYVSKSKSPTDRPKTVAELRKSVNTASNHIDSSSRGASTPKSSRTGDKKSTAYGTYAPIRHNMGVLQSQPSTSTMSPFVYEHRATTQANMQLHSQKAGNSQTFSFYGSRQN